MHPQAYSLVERLAPKDVKCKVLDVGSYDVNGTLKPIFQGHDYVGLDITSGPNVDVVSNPFSWPFDSESFDLVVSSSCLEHVPDPHRWAAEIKRVLKPGGTVVITAPHTIHYHNPPHFWNIRKDALAMLFNDFKILECGEGEIDSYIKAVKP